MSDEEDVNRAYARFCREYMSSENLDVIRTDRAWIDDRVPIVDDRVFAWRLHFVDRWREAFARPLLTIKTYTYSFTLDTRIDNTLFWRVPILPYEMEHVGAIAKQLRVVSTSAADVEAYQRALAAHRLRWPHVMVTETVFTPSSPTVLDYRRLQLGIVGKQLRVVSRRPRRAFSHCIVVYLRWRPSGAREYLETHVKIFSTGQVYVLGMPVGDHEAQFRDLFWRSVMLPTLDIAGPRPHLMPGTAQPLMLNATLLFGCHLLIPRLRECLATRSAILAIEPMVVRCRYHAQPEVTCTTFWTGSLLFSGAVSIDVLERAARTHLNALLEWLDLIHDATSTALHLKKPAARNHDNKFTYEMDNVAGEWVDPAPDLWKPRDVGERVRICGDDACFQYFVGTPFGAIPRKTLDGIDG